MVGYTLGQFRLTEFFFNLKRIHIKLMNNYPTSLGAMKLDNCIYNAAGVWDTTKVQCDDLFMSPATGAVITKSCTIESRTGNSQPKYHFTDLRSINSNGLENNGIYFYLQLCKGAKPFIYSVGGLSNDERAQILDSIHHCSTEPANVEINLSCPNLGCAGPAYDPDTLETALRQLLGPPDSKLEISINSLGLKLPPFYLLSDFNAIANVLERWDHCIDYVTCINSIPNGLDYDVNTESTVIRPNGGYGGIGGPAILPVALANVNRFSTIFKEEDVNIQVVGCGGISSGEDVYKHFLAGASAVQVGTALWKSGPQILEQINKEFSLIMRRKGYTSLLEILN